MDELQKRRPKTDRSIGELASEAGAAAFRKFGFTEHRLLTQWPAIAGDVMGQLTQPLKLSFPRNERSGGTLKILAEGAAALELQHLAPLLIQRINGVFGYPAVEKLKIVQGPVRAKERHAELPEPTKDEMAQIAATLPPIENERLRMALARLGAAIKTRNSHPK